MADQRHPDPDRTSADGRTGPGGEPGGLPGEPEAPARDGDPYPNVQPDVNAAAATGPSDFSPPDGGGVVIPMPGHAVPQSRPGAHRADPPGASDPPFPIASARHDAADRARGPFDPLQILPPAPAPAPPVSPMTPTPPTGEVPLVDPEPFPFPDPKGPASPRPVQVSPSTGPITQPTMMIRPFDAPPPGWPGDASDADGSVDGRPLTQSEADAEADLPDPGAPASLVRPYARTGGRTKPGRDLNLEALVRTTDSGRDAWHSPLLTPEHTSVIELCSGTVSVAEIAARLTVPLGVARVIIADMVDLGLVEVMKTSSATGDERDPAFLRRVLSGLQRL
jgi:hypothetical protein